MSQNTPHEQLQSQIQGSPLSCAWKDFCRSPHKLSIIVKLMLFQIIPVLGGIVRDGYALDWACEQMNKTHMPMERKIVRHGVLDKGLYALGTSAMIAIVSFIALCILAGGFSALNLDAIFFLVLLAFLIIMGPLTSIMIVRSAYYERVREGLHMRRAWDMLTRPGKTGQAFAASWLPIIIKVIVDFLVWALVMSIFIGSLFYVISAYPGLGRMMYGYGTYIEDAILAAQIIGLFLVYLPVILVINVVLSAIDTIVSLVTYRAFGYWMLDFELTSTPRLDEVSSVTDVKVKHETHEPESRTDSKHESESAPEPMTQVTGVIVPMAEAEKPAVEESSVEQESAKPLSEALSASEGLSTDPTLETEDSVKDNFELDSTPAADFQPEDVSETQQEDVPELQSQDISQLTETPEDQA